ncbi:DUF6676 family protein [Gordonia sp. CPCC 205515]|uniref:Rv1476 family membrane protein n=1 Tax=Gordonia sp. CPCC 205515 TaxID=3140791 RepID=UPI003AF35E27
MTTGLQLPGQHVLALPPLAMPAPSVIPEDVDMNALLADIQDDGVAAPDGADVAGLQKVVADAKADGYQLSIVVLDKREPKFTYYRDIATELQSEVGGTVMVLAPDSVGSASPYFSRVEQEQATENLTLTDPPAAAQKFWDQMSGPSLNWTAISLVLIVIVVIGAVIARLRQVRRRDTTASDAAADNASAAPSDAATEPSTDETNSVDRPS